MKQRNSSFELLRIIAMVLIVAHHFAVHGGFYFQNTSLTANLLILQLLSLGGKISVNLFVMITGYFTILSETWSGKKAMKTWLQIFFYSLVIYLISCIGGLADFTAGGLAKSCLPILSKQWWFASAWFMMYLLSPWLNRLLQRLSQKQYRIWLVVLGIAWCVVPVLPRLPERTRDLSWFLYLYALAGYLRLYGQKRKHALAAGIGCYLITFCHSAAILYFRARSGGTYEMVYYNMFHILLLITSILLFQGFAQWKLPYHKGINTLAQWTFGVYLIHDSDHLRYFLWRELAKCASFRDSAWLLPYALAMIAAVYLACSGLEALRQKLLEKPFTVISQRTFPMKR